MGKNLNNVGDILNPEINKVLNASVKKFLEEVELDKEKGLDINDIKSIEAFELGYTPTGNVIIVKEIKKDSSYGMVIMPDMANTRRLAVIIEIGIFVNEFKKGDIVAFKEVVKDNFFNDLVVNDIRFKEIDGDAVSGVYQKRETIMKRLK